MTFLAINPSRQVAGHAATALRLYARLMERDGYNCPEVVLDGLADLEFFLAEVGQGRTQAAKKADTGRPSPHDEKRELISQKEAAHIAGRSPRTIRRWIDQGHLEAIQSGGIRRVSAIDLERLLDDGTL